VLQIAVQDPGFKARLADLSSVAATTAAATPEALRTQLKSELERWGMVIKQAGVVPE
jgi:tripartite-type tricarboxylate transporter receptor subunit TctC